jgi:hypothetical protein
LAAPVLFWPSAKTPAPGDDAPPWVAHQQAARAAREAKDYAAYRTHLLALNDLFFGHPTIVYSLAVAELQLGNRDAALKWLTTFATMGLYQNVVGDPSLAALRELPEFQQLIRRMEENQRPVSHSTLAFALSEPAFIVEDIAWDARGKRFFVSSMRKRKIIVVDAAGRSSDFVPAARQGIWSVLALAVDSRHGVLWASTAAMPQGEGYQKADEGRTALLKYDLRSGALLKRYDLAAGLGQHVLGDMTLSAAGDVYVSDCATRSTFARLRLPCCCPERRSCLSPTMAAESP